MAGQINKGSVFHQEFGVGKNRSRLQGSRHNSYRRNKGPGTSPSNIPLPQAPTPGPMTGGARIIKEGFTHGTMW